VHYDRFFRWYDHEHKHSGIALHAPTEVHYGLADEICRHRSTVLEGAYSAHPGRFVRKPPEPPTLPAVSAINPPPKEDEPTP